MVDDLLINKLVIHSFKSVVEQEILLGRVNVFVGANGSGKSNALAIRPSQIKRFAQKVIYKP